MRKYIPFIVISALSLAVIIPLVSDIKFQEVVGAFGIVFVGYCWLNGKSVTKAATEFGIKVGSAKPQRPPSESFYVEPRAVDPKNPPVRERAVFLYRKPRREGGVKEGGTSWLGGLPALGDVKWPHDSAGRPMHHVMQIDLADAAPLLNVPGLPMYGSLAVFVSLGQDQPIFETKVCYVTQPRGETPPPEGLSAVGNHSFGGLAVHTTDPASRMTLPRWAVDLVQLTLADEIGPEDHQILTDELSAVRPLGTGMNVSAFVFADHLPNGKDPSYWHSAQIFADSVGRAAGYEASLPPGDRALFHMDAQELTDLFSTMENRAADLAKWASAHDPWDVMSPADLEVFKHHFAQFEYGNKDSDLARLYRSMPGSYSFLTNLADATLKEMVRGPDEVFRVLPKAIQTATDVDYLTPRVPHQMFGPPAWIQDGPAFHEPDHLLLQIVDDALIGLELAAGHIQVWISPDDLAAQNWDGITSVFECT